MCNITLSNASESFDVQLYRCLQGFLVSVEPHLTARPISQTAAGSDVVRPGCRRKQLFADDGDFSCSHANALPLDEAGLEIAVVKDRLCMRWLSKTWRGERRSSRRDGGGLAGLLVNLDNARS